jgi:hypothetical protein
MEITANHNFPEVDRAMKTYARQVPFAMARALTLTAGDVREAEKVEMRRVFDRPTPFTINGLFVKRATKAELTARVWFKNAFGTEPHFLEPQVHGGQRPLKRFEQMLVRAGYMRRGERAVPGEGAKLDQYGNIGRGELQRILSQVRAFNLAGASQNATSSRRSRAGRARQAFFVSDGRGSTKHSTTNRRSGWASGEKMQHLPRGIWSRTAFAWGTAVKPVMLFVSGATYARQFDFFGVANRTIKARFSTHFAKAHAEAVRTARR